MAQRRTSTAPVPTIAVDAALVMAVADEVERRLLRILRPEPIAQGATQHTIDAADLMRIKEAAHLAGKSDETIRRWAQKFDLTIVVGGATFVSRNKLHAHLARPDVDDA